VVSAVGVALFFRARPGVPVETRAWEIAPNASSPTAQVAAPAASSSSVLRPG
jgi:hypothetical protein